MSGNKKGPCEALPMFKASQNASKHQMLRPYQEEAKRAVLGVINQVAVMHLVVMPTGSGKTKLIASIAESLPDKQVLILTPRCKLLHQMREVLGFHGVLSGSLGNDLGDFHGLVIATNQTAILRKELIAPDVILIDEAHFVSDTGVYAQFLRKYPNAKVIGFTATPYRSNQHLEKRFHGSRDHLPWKILYEKDMIELIDEGYLVTPQSMSTSAADLFYSDILPTRHVVTRHNIIHLVAAIKNNHRKRCIVFCEDISHADATASLLREQGQVSVFVVHSGMPYKAQQKAYQAFEFAQGESWLVNVGLVSMGVDIPCTDSIAIMRDVSSIALLIQMIGRGLRPFENKVSCLIFDFGNGTSRFGFIDSPRLLEPKEFNKKSGSGRHLFQTCSKCQALLHLSAKVCPHCGLEFEGMLRINAAARSIQLLSSTPPRFSSQLTEHMFVRYGGATQAQQSNGTWLITHTVFEQDRKLTIFEAVKNEKSEPNRFEKGHLFLARRRSDAQMEFVRQSKENKRQRRRSGSGTPSRNVL